MAEDGSTQSANIWPLPKFHFQVKWGDQEMSFQEVTGLDAQSEEIKYRSGDSPIFSPVKMPGLVKYSNVTMKKGIFKGDNKFWGWFKKIKMNTIERTTVTISLLDEGGAETIIGDRVFLGPGTKVLNSTYKLNGYPTYELENTYKLTDGKAIITMPSGVIGEKTIVFSTDENDPDYELKILSKKINVTKFHSEIHVKNVINETYGEIIDLTPSIHEIYNERYIRVQNGNVITRIMRNHPILTGYINIYNGNDLLTKVKINSEGILDYSCEKYLLSNLNAGEYQIKYVYNGDDYFNSCEKTILLNISKLNQPSTYNIMNNIEGETVTLSYFIANSATGKYHLTIPDYYDKSGKLYNGGIEVSIPNILNSGKYNCIFYYYGDENYEGTNITHQLTIKSKLYSENISYDFNNLNTDTSSFLIKLPEETSGKIILKINNENYEFEVVNGLCNIKLPTLTNGNYQYTLSYLGNDDYAPFTITNTLNINKPTTKPNTPTTTKILLTLKNVKVKKTNKKLILQAILKQGNNPLKSKKIIFKFNGKKYAAKTNKKGVAKVTTKKKVLKKLKVGKKVRYQASYGEITVKKSVKVKK